MITGILLFGSIGIGLILILFTLERKETNNAEDD